jgi:hypothetical protein
MHKCELRVGEIASGPQSERGFTKAIVAASASGAGTTGTPAAGTEPAKQDAEKHVYPSTHGKTTLLHSA